MSHKLYYAVNVNIVLTDYFFVLCSELNQIHYDHWRKILYNLTFPLYGIFRVLREKIQIRLIPA